jgi:hypothetical protein
MGHIIDMAEQAYFSSCIEVNTSSMLDHLFTLLWSNILSMDMMPAMIVIPHSLATMVLQN